MATHELPESLRHLAVPIASLHPYPRNPRQGDIGAISESLRAHNQYRPVVVRRADNTVLAGNHTMAAAKALGWQEIAATFVDVDDDEAARIVLVDNRTADLASNNPEALAVLLQELAATPAALQGTGYNGDALDELLADLGQMQPELAGDPDAVPEVPAEPVSRRGDLWRCGEHLILCGDATVRADVERVLEGAQADLVWTDPPYGVAVAGGSHDPRAPTYRGGPTLVNDDLDPEPLEQLLRAAFGLVWSACRPGAAWYVASPAIGRAFYAFASALIDLDVWRHSLVWVKQSAVFGRADYHYRHEHIFYGWRSDGPHRAVPDRTQTSVWEVDRPMGSTDGPADGPAIKPVELVARAVRNSSQHGDVVLDTFAGTGTTMIACEQEGRRACLIDVDPRYVDVTVRRWEQLTGKTAVREQIVDDARVLSRA